KLPHSVAQALDLVEPVARKTGAARKADLFLAQIGLNQIPWQIPSRAPKVDLKRERVRPVGTVKHPVKRRIRKKSAIPIVLPLDLYRRETRRQGAACEDVVQPDPMRRRIEIEKIATSNVDGAYAQTGWPVIQQLEIHEPLKGRTHGGYVVKAQ